ncbi:MAG TPA: S9 family peptidase [Chitinophagaceae bacterium]|nr:S9 family peptidase [Chitinophagaceae bacterium]
MRRIIYTFSILLSNCLLQAQSPISPEKLLSLGRVNPQGMSKDGKIVYYSVSVPNIDENKNNTKFYSIPTQGGQAIEIPAVPQENLVTVEQTDAENIKASAASQKVIYTKEVKVAPSKSTERYPNLSKSNAYIYDDLNQRHWDTWEDGYYSHLFIADIIAGFAVREKDLFAGQAFDCPQKPHGGAEDLLFTPDGSHVIYVTKKKSGKAYAISTNTDIYAYQISSGETTNLTEGMEGYDTNPAFNKDGSQMAWLSMKTDGFESDKNELWVMDMNNKIKRNLTEDWDENVASFTWSDDGKKIFFIAPTKDTEQLYELNLLGENGNGIRQITKGKFDVTGIAGQHENTLIVSRTDMNHAAELYTVDMSTGKMNQLTHVNDDAYRDIAQCEIKERYTELETGEKLFSWAIYPPNFDPGKKYPLLLYCQGGPQSALSQFYSYRWNFQLMASQGYIVIAPNRTGMPGWGVKWNADISKDWGGNPMHDYLAAVDDISEESYIDKDRRAAVGASYGGYSVFMLAGIHENRFKTLISHCGLFDLKSWYGTTEELWFANWDVGGPYWEKDNPDAQKSYKFYNPSNYVQDWNTPILVIQGGKDFRVPIEQGLQAFQAAQLKGIKSRFLYLPEENHWVLKPQNALVWHSEFYKWLKETL